IDNCAIKDCGTPLRSGHLKSGGTSGTPPILDAPIDRSYSPASFVRNRIESFARKSISFNKRDRPAATKAARTPAISIKSTSLLYLNSFYILIKPYFITNVTLPKLQVVLRQASGGACAIAPEAFRIGNIRSKET